MEPKYNLKELIGKFSKKIRELRRKIHENPELAFCEFETQKLIIDTLKKLGLKSKKCAKTGVICDINGYSPGKCVALRADMDALNIEEKTDLPFKSKNKGKMHACGHDGHVAILLGCAMVLNELKDKFKGTVRLIFQPAEEGPGGAKKMIEQGALKNPDVDLILGAHIYSSLPVNTIGYKYGISHGNPASIKVTIEGKGGHASSPQMGIDAIYLAALFITSVQAIVSRWTDPLESVVITFGKICGGYRENVLSGKVEIEGTARTLDTKATKELLKKINACGKGICETFGGKFKLTHSLSYPPVINNKKAVDLVREVAELVVTPANVIDFKKPSLGGEDFAYYLQKVPGCFFGIGGGSKQKKAIYPLHHPKYTFDEKALDVGVAVFCAAALKFMSF